MPGAAATWVLQGMKQPSLALRVIETVILSSYLLFWIPPIIGQIHSWSHSSYLETVIPENSPEIWLDHVDVCSSTIGIELIFNHLGYLHMCSVDTFIREPKTENVTAENVSKMFRKYFQEGSSLKSVAVYSCPLNAPFSSSKVSVKKRVQRQYSALDYHAFVVFESNVGVWIALDKMIDGVFISWGRNQGSVLFHFEGKFRPKPLRLLKKDDCNSSRSELIHHLEKLLNSNSYDLIQENCQHFSKKMFDKHAVGLSWDFATPSDLTSVLKFFSNGGLPMIMLVFFVCWLTELSLLLKRSEYRPAHPNIVYLTVVITSLLYGIILVLGRDKGVWKHFSDIISPMFMSFILVFTQFLEVIFSPSGIVKRRASHYGRNLWKSGNVLIKGSLIFCFTTMYTVTTVLAIAYILKSVLTYCETFSLSILLRGTQWLTELLQMGVNLEAFSVFLVIWLSTYFIVKEYFYHPKLVIPIEYDCPLEYGKGNGTSTLNEILQHNGCKHAGIVDIKYNETSFTSKISFILLDKNHEYMSDTKCRNKREARQNAAFVALVDLRLMKPHHNKKAGPLNEAVGTDGSPGKNSKNRLQEFCQKYNHELPVYETEEFTDDNFKLFVATATVKLSNGFMVNETSDRLRSKKEADFQAAERAVTIITSGLRSRNNSSDSLASMSSLRSVPDDVNSREFKRHTGLPNTDRRGSSPAPGHFRSGTASPKPSSEKNCKNLLQEFCQREGLEFPSYVTNDEGSKGMKPLFVSEVTITLKSGETLSAKSNKHSRKKDAEMMAAERAYRSIPATRFPTPPVREASPVPNINNSPDKSYKNLLQEFCAQRAYPAPQYVTEDVGDEHEHVYVSEVIVELEDGIQFTSKSDRLSKKKAAEVQAAKRAYEKIRAKDNQAAGS